MIIRKFDPIDSIVIYFFTFITGIFFSLLFGLKIYKMIFVYFWTVIPIFVIYRCRIKRIKQDIYNKEIFFETSRKVFFIVCALPIAHFIFQVITHGNVSNISKFNFDNRILIVFSVFFTPIVEEIFFRGILFRSLSQKYDIKLAFAFTSVLFCILHGLNPNSFIFSLLTCLIYYKGNILIFPIIYHILSNFFSYLLIYLKISNVI